MPDASSAQELIEGLAKAASTYDVATAAAVCEKLVARIHASPEPFGETETETAMELLRRIKAFDLMSDLGDATIAGGQDAPTVHRLYAQALIETARLVAAEAVLLGLLERPDIGDEVPEVRGLLGRTYKDRYIHIGDPNASGAAVALEKAIEEYLGVYREDKTKTWHGINAVAVLARGRRDGIEVEGPDHREMAGEILGHISTQWLTESATAWDAATAMEAAVALDDVDEARLWLVRYADSSSVSAFALAGSLRQLQDVWQVDANSKMGEIIHVLRGHTIERGDGGRVEITELADPESFEQRSGGLEKTFGQAGAVTVRWWLEAQERLEAIARIEDESGQAIGTGFVVNGGDLTEEWDGQVVMVTNAHVVSREYSRAILPEDGWVNFTLLDTDERYRVDDVLFESDPNNLDCAVLRLESIPERVVPVEVATRLPLADGEQRLYVMGHPLGGELKISIDDNVLLDHDDLKVHYRAPTEPGSSGSPVFNRMWQLIALHHAGNDHMEKLHGQKGTYQANEGIAIKAIKARLASTAPESSPE